MTALLAKRFVSSGGGLSRAFAFSPNAGLASIKSLVISGDKYTLELNSTDSISGLHSNVVIHSTDEATGTEIERTVPAVRQLFLTHYPAAPVVIKDKFTEPFTIVVCPRSEGSLQFKTSMGGTDASNYLKMLAEFNVQICILPTGNSGMPGGVLARPHKALQAWSEQSGSTPRRSRTIPVSIQAHIVKAMNATLVNRMETCMRTIRNVSGAAHVTHDTLHPLTRLARDTVLSGTSPAGNDLHDHTYDTELLNRLVSQWNEYVACKESLNTPAVEHHYPTPETIASWAPGSPVQVPESELATFDARGHGWCVYRRGGYCTIQNIASGLANQKPDR